MSRSALHWVLVVAGAVMITGLFGTCLESRGAEPAAATPWSLQKKISVDFANRPFSEAISDLAKLANTQIELDNFALKEIGFKLDRPVTLKLSNVSLQSVLRHLLRDLDLDFVLRYEMLIVTTPDEANKCLASRVYNVRDLITTTNKLTDDYDYDPLIELITSTVKPTSWDAVGGAGSIKGFQGALVVSQIYGFHDEVAALISALRQARGLTATTKQGQEPVLVGDRPEHAALRGKLDQQVDLGSGERPLAEWVALIAEKYEIPIVFDRRALADLGLTPDAPVKSSTANVSLRTALKLLLRSLDMTFVIQDEALLITTPDEANKRIVERVYKVPDLVVTHDEHGQERFDYGSLIEVITSTVKPTSWDTRGGPATAKGFDEAKALVVAQIAEFQEEVEDLLHQIRAARVEQEAQDAPDRNKSTTTPEYFVGRYELKLPQTGGGESGAVEQIIRVVKDLTGPGSWKKDAGYVEGVGTTLVVRQTPDVHRQVAKLLKDLRFLGEAVPTRGSNESGTQYRRVRRGT